MALKSISFGIVVLAVSVMYLHEYHRDKVLYFSNNPILKPYIATIHNLVVDLNRKLSPDIPKSTDDSERLYTSDELWKYNGKKGSPGIYLAIFGEVFDVSKGSQHYAEDKSYHGFAGRDATRSFSTGDFTEEGLTDDVMGLPPKEIKSLKEWALFYHKEYIYKGKLIGRYYNSKGEKTEYHEKVDTLVQQAIDDMAAEDADHIMYPPCNVEWNADTGSRIWCSQQSGGVERDWEGVPRKYFKPGAEDYRCACVNIANEEALKSGKLQEYEGCSARSKECYIKN